MLKTILFSLLFLLCNNAESRDSLTTQVVVKQESAYIQPDTQKTIHRIEAEFLPAAILHTNDYLTGGNSEHRTMNHANTFRLKYALMQPSSSKQARIYGNPYQGIGAAYHEFNHQTGNPFSLYLFQGAQLARLSKNMKLNYEWNFGLTFGWKPYDKVNNPDNHIIGSKVTAYMDLDVYLCWQLSEIMDLNVGVQVSHFSNGNTKLPNSGLNVLGVKMGLACYINRSEDFREKRIEPKTPFAKHISYDLVVFGAWRSKGLIDMGADGTDIIPGSAGVAGFSFSPTWNFSHKLNVSMALDGIYDHSANLTISKEYLRLEKYEDRIRCTETPAAYRQMMLGLSARSEFVMPYFSINAGVGHSVYGHGDMKGFYQILALKVNVWRQAYLHIGYSLHDFKIPNHLMLGIGYRFGSKRNI